jgi:predicted lipoprotein with Yx(FWY)xxD motif
MSPRSATSAARSAPPCSAPATARAPSDRWRRREDQTAAAAAADAPKPGDARPPGDRPGRSRSGGETVKVADSRYGRILVDGDGRTLYLFDKERGGSSECYGACAQAWPPLLTKGLPRAAGAADAKLIGTTKRSDGSVQVSYRGHPLYHYHGETEAGQVLCQNVSEFGGVWLVVDPGGDAIR